MGDPLRTLAGDRMPTAVPPPLDVQFYITEPDGMAPQNAYGNDAGWDLFALTDTAIGEYGITDIRTGIAVAIPDGFYGRVVARSSAWRKKGIGIVEGIIDAGFRGELFAGAYLLHNIALDGHHQAFEVMGPTVKKGESVCQLIIQEVKPVRFVQVPELPESLRGERGFGSSGN